MVLVVMLLVYAMVMFSRQFEEGCVRMRYREVWLQLSLMLSM